MKSWIDEAFAYWENVHAGAPEDPVKVEEFDRRYDEIMAQAAEEYEYEPPSNTLWMVINCIKGCQRRKKGIHCFSMIHRLNQPITWQKGAPGNLSERRPR